MDEIGSEFKPTGDQPAGQTASIPGQAGAAERPGTRIGPYKLLQLIGEGGFGTVFMAEQEEPVRRRVALKVIKLGMDTRQVIARFEAERQALAMMDHPNIAKVLDAGATDTGRPYFVMELVKGIPITEYCDRSTLTTSQRLDLFQQVCHAVQHAHTKGIIHRDLKPSNVLVSSQDGRPLPQVIDFGIAKATAGRLTEKTVFTELRQFIGTPEYMSPEQAEMTAADIDTRADIYSLGVLLYELLTGTTPFDSRRLRSAAHGEIQRIIREEEPARPSTRLSSLRAGPPAPDARDGKDHAPAIAARRRTDLRTLVGTVRGDLDWIVMKCLEKDRTRRYDTASALAADILRHLAGEPVLAAPPSAAYRARKFVRRNRVSVVAAALVGAALILGIIGTTVGLVRAARQREIVLKQRNTAAETLARIAAELRRSVDGARAGAPTPGWDGAPMQPETVDRLAAATLQLLDTLAQTRAAETRQRMVAEAQRDKAEQVAGFMADTLQGAAPGVALGRDTTIVKEMMDSAAARIAAGELKDAPEAELTLRVTIGHTYRQINEFSAAESILRPVVQQARALAGTSSIESGALAESLHAWGCFLRDAGRANEAEPLLLEAAEILRRSPGGDRPFLAGTLTDLAVTRQRLGRLDEAESLHEEALGLNRRFFAENRAEVAWSLQNLALVRQELGRPAEAEPLYLQALEIYQQAYRAGSPHTATVLNNLGLVRQALGRVAEAEPLYRQSLEMRESLLQGDHSDISQSLNNLAYAVQALGRFDEAEALLRRALEMNQRLFPGDHPFVCSGLSNLGVLLHEQGHPAQGAPLLEQALDVARRLYTEDHPSLAFCLTTLAGARLSLGREAEAQALYREALDMRRRLFGGDHPDVAWALNNLPVLLHAMRRAGEAEPLFSQGAAMAERVWPHGHPQRAVILIRWAECLRDLGRADEARQAGALAVPMAAEMFPEGHPARVKIESIAAGLAPSK